MRLLLDTSCLYELMAARGRFPENLRRVVEDPEARLWVSAVSIWEMKLKHNARRASGERKSPHDPNDVLALLEELGIAILPVPPEHMAAELEPPLHHGDLFDEMLLVQAQEEGMRLLTIDRLLADHPLALSA